MKKPFDKYLAEYNRFVSDSYEALQKAKVDGDVEAYNKLQKRRRKYHYNVWLAAKGFNPKTDKTEKLKEDFLNSTKECMLTTKEGLLQYSRGREDKLPKPKKKPKSPSKENRSPVIKDFTECIYLWRLSGIYQEGEAIYKVGITKYRRGATRIIEDATELGVKPDLIRLKPIYEASTLEQKLLKFGTPVGIYRYSGCTELRALRKAEFAAVVALIDAEPLVNVVNPAWDTPQWRKKSCQRQEAS